MSKEQPSRMKAEVGRTILRAAFRFDTHDEHNHLSEVNSFLEGGGSLILYSNHIAYNDPLLAVLFYTQYLDPKRKRHLFMPVSHWNTDAKNNRPFYLFSRGLEYFFDVEMFRLIQDYMIDNPEFPQYSTEVGRENHAAFALRLKALHDRGIPTSMIIFPEGTRSKDGVIHESAGDFSPVGRILRPSVFVPLGIHYKTPFSRNALNTRLKGSRAQLTVGTPIFIQSKFDRPSSELLMQNLAQTLPFHMRNQHSG